MTKIMKRIFPLLAFAFLLSQTQAAQLDGAVRINSGTSGFRDRSSRITVTGDTNLFVGTLTSTGAVTAASLTLPGPDPGTIALNSGGTIRNGGTAYALTNDLPVKFASNVVFSSTITDSAGSVGTSGQVLKSGGAGAGTTYGTDQTAFVLGPFTAAAGQNPANGTTYYFGANTAGWSSTVTQGRFAFVIPPLPGGATTATLIGYSVSVYGTGGGSEDVGYAMNYDSGTIVGSTTADWTSFPVRTTVSGLSQTVTVGHHIDFRVVAPTWASPPTACSINAVAMFTVP